MKGKELIEKLQQYKDKEIYINKFCFSPKGISQSFVVSISDIKILNGNVILETI